MVQPYLGAAVGGCGGRLRRQYAYAWDMCADAVSVLLTLRFLRFADPKPTEDVEGVLDRGALWVDRHL